MIFRGTARRDWTAGRFGPFWGLLQQVLTGRLILIETGVLGTTRILVLRGPATLGVFRRFEVAHFHLFLLGSSHITSDSFSCCWLLG